MAESVLVCSAGRPEVPAEQVEDKAGGHLVQGLRKACFCIGGRGHLGSALTFEDLQKTGCKY